MTLKYKLLTFKRNVNFAIVLGGELNSYRRTSLAVLSVSMLILVLVSLQFPEPISLIQMGCLVSRTFLSF